MWVLCNNTCLIVRLTKEQNLYAEVTFVCPSYWFADAFDGNGKTSYKYQFSVIPALHGYDSFTYFGPLGSNMSPSFQQAFICNSLAHVLPEALIMPADSGNSHVPKLYREWERCEHDFRNCTF